MQRRREADAIARLVLVVPTLLPARRNDEELRAKVHFCVRELLEQDTRLRLLGCVPRAISRVFALA
jgi:hypothetical protein